jgi:hypothetical protein
VGPQTNAISITIRDDRSEQQLAFEVDSTEALAAFHHPYAYAGKPHLLRAGVLLLFAREGPTSQLTYQVLVAQRGHRCGRVPTTRQAKQVTATARAPLNATSHRTLRRLPLLRTQRPLRQG